MELSISNDNKGINIKISGQFTFSDHKKFQDVLRCAQEDGIRSMALNFAEVDFIDSAGLGMLLMLRNTCQSNHIPISLQAAHGQVEKVFTISKFDQLFFLDA